MGREITFKNHLKKKNMKKTTFMTLALLMVSALFNISLVSCSSDDDEENGSNNPIINQLVGTWTFGNATLTFNRNFTGSFKNSGTRGEFYDGKTYKVCSDDGDFKYGNPYEVEEIDGEVWFLIDFNYTSGEAKGWTTDWEIHFKKDDQNAIYTDRQKWIKKP